MKILFMTSLFSGGKVTPRPKTAQSPFLGIFIGLGFYGQRIKLISALSAGGGVGRGRLFSFL
jgi:hypothetical protein